MESPLDRTSEPARTPVDRVKTRPARRSREELGNEAPMVITPRAVVELVRRSMHLLRRRPRRGRR